MWTDSNTVHTPYKYIHLHTYRYILYCAVISQFIEWRLSQSTRLSCAYFRMLLVVVGGIKGRGQNKAEQSIPNKDIDGEKQGSHRNRYSKFLMFALVLCTLMGS